MLTPQKVFDTACLALINQRKKSVSPEREGGTCQYRGMSKTKCAIGHLITDAEYDPLMDRPSYAGGMGNHQVLLLVSQKLKVDYAFLRDLQRCHDQAEGYFLPEFVRRAKTFATHFNLNTKVLENA